MLPADGCQGGSLFSLQPLKPNLTPQRKQLQASSSIRCRDRSCPLLPVVYQPIKSPIWHKQVVMAPAFCACDEQFPSSFNKRSGRSQVALTRLPPERDMIESAKSSSYGVCSHLLLQPARQSSNSTRLGSSHQPSCSLTFRGINLCALAKQNPAVSTPRNIQTGLENRQADTPDWSKYRVAGLSK